jgi:ribulose kinase
LTRKYYVTLESIALQTRHILDTMNASGHDIRALYVSGGQVRNKMMMRLLAEVCGVPVVLPDEYGSAVVLGAAMLGKFAKEVAERGSVEVVGDALWKIMVCFSGRSIGFV